MTRMVAIVLLMLAGCDSAEDPAGIESAKEAVQTATLTGLYEGKGAPPSQLCILDRGMGNASFGLVVQDEQGRSCSGAGAAVREGGLLRLTMTGDEPCEIEAAIVDGRVAFPAALSPDCSYYCGSGAAMAGASFDKVGGAAEDAMRARDLVGDRLCAG